MMVFNMSERGKWREVEVDGSDGQGIILRIGGAGNPVGSASLVTTFGAAQSENFAVSQCLNGGIYLYSYGHDPQRSQFTVGVTTFLRPCSGQSDLGNLIKAYSSGRVSESKAISTLSVGTGTLRGYLIGQNIETVDNTLGVVCASFSFVTLDPQ